MERITLTGSRVCIPVHKRKKGLSLVEILISIGLVGFVIISLVQLLLAGHFAIRQEREVVTATGVATSQLDNTKTYFYNMAKTQILPTKLYEGTLGQQDPVGFPPRPYPTVEINGTVYTVNVETKFPPSCEGLRHVSITVSWESKSAFSIEKGGGTGRISRNVNLTTIMMEP